MTTRQWALRVPFGTLFDGDRIRRAAVAIWLNVLVGGVVLAAAIATGPMVDGGSAHPPGWPTRAVTLFAIWLLSFVPGWLYIRFLGLRADALWSEYVLTLYRLGLDAPACLPPPPAESAYAALPGANDGGHERSNIYRQKFNAYYGRKVSARRSDTEDFRVSVDTLFPVFVCTATLAVCWTVVLWHPEHVVTPVEPWATLQFGFLGAYVFSVLMLVRRFYQSDLRPIAYASVVVRLIVVLLVLAVLQQVFAIDASSGGAARATHYVSAFVVGFFPLVGVHAMQRIAAKALGVVVPQLTPDYPLEQLDGLNIWYEARLVEEGVEDMQNLATMNLVDVILHTRAPVGRLVDWIDQALLLIHLDPATRDDIARARTQPAPAGGSGAYTRQALRRLGVRSATDLLRAFDGMPPAALTARGLDPAQIETLVRLLAEEPALNPVWNWKAGGAARNAPGQVAPAVTGAAGLPRRRSAPEARHDRRVRVEHAVQGPAGHRAVGKVRDETAHQLGR